MASDLIIPEHSRFLLGLARYGGGGYFRACHRIQYSGFDAIPEEGPVILAPNHVSYFDPLLVGIGTRRKVYYLAWNALFRNPMFARVIRGLGAIPLDVKDGSGADRAAYAMALRLLQEGHAVCLFPEGQRCWDGRLAPLKSGVGRLAATTAAPVCPVWISGAFDAWPRFQTLPRPFIPFRVECHAPIYPRTVDSAAERRHEAARILSDLDRVLRSEDRKMPPPRAALALQQPKQG